MVLQEERKHSLIETFRVHPGDTGSPEVQVALLTEKIQCLGEHLKVHRRDYTSRRGLLVMVGKRSRLLRYLQRTNAERYASLVRRLDLRR